MSGRKISFAVSAVLALTSVFGGTAAFADPEDPGYTARDVTVCYFNNEDTGTVKALFFDDLPSVPYVSAVDYINFVFTQKGYASLESEPGKFEISGPSGSFVIDTDKDTLHFDDFERFINKRTNVERMLPAYVDFAECELISELHAADIDMSQYGIDLQAVDGTVYFPLSTLSDLFAMTQYTAIWYNDAVYMIDLGTNSDSYIDYSALLNNTERTEDMARFAYSELCFVIDNLYGNPPKTALAASITEKGLDRTLLETSETTAETRSKLLSTDRTEYAAGIYMLDTYLFDGGHNGFSVSFWNRTDALIQSTTATSTLDFIKNNLVIDGLEAYYLKLSGVQQQMQEVASVRAETIPEEIYVKTWNDCSYAESGDTGIFIFDSFADSVVASFKESLDLAEEHGMKNFVIDLSCNMGGASDVVVYMISMISGRDYISFGSSISGNSYRDHFKVDKNLDGVFDEKDDEVSYDMNFAILCSHIGFSSSNALTACAKDEGIAILGEQTNGGCCARLALMLPEGLSLCYSADIIIQDKYFNDVDSGVVPDYILTSGDEGETDHSALYDFDKISEYIHEFYGDNDDSEPESSETEDSSEPDSQDTSVPDSGKNTNPNTGKALSFTICAAVIAVFAAVITVGRKRSGKK